MYAKWCSCTNELLNSLSSPSVLEKFSPTVSKEIATISIRQILEGSKNNSEDKSPLPDVSVTGAEELNWILEVIGFALTMNHGDNSIVHEVAFLCTKWIESIHQPKLDSVPLPVVRDPLYYLPVLLSHLLNLMHNRREPRFFATHNKLCFSVLSRIFASLENSNISDSVVWESVLKFHLQATEIRILSDWHQNSGITNKPLLCQLFSVWSLSALRVFPSPRMWRTLYEFCQLWLDRSSTAEIWISTVLEATFELLRRRSVIPKKFSARPDEFAEVTRIFQVMPSPLLAQTWFHHLHILGNPVKLASPDFTECYKMTLSRSKSEISIKCAGCISKNFMAAMKGLSQLIDLFIESVLFCRGVLKRSSVVHCDTILNIFGRWIFEAAIHATVPPHSRISPNFKESLEDQGPSIIQEISNHIIGGSSVACGIMCRLICSKDSRESILPVYLVRFYYVLLRILGEDVEKSDSVLVHVFSNAKKLFLINLPATNVILYRFVISIRHFLPKYEELQLEVETGPALQGVLEILQSIICVPTYYQEMRLLSLLGSSRADQSMEWIHISSTIIDVLINALTMKLETEHLSRVLNMIIVTVTELTVSEANSGKYFVVSNKGFMLDRIDFFSQKLTTCITDNWRSSNSRILAGIQALEELGRVNLSTSSSNERRKTIMWICGFIRTRYKMSTDGGGLEMSSVLLATYNCLLAWLSSSFSILGDPCCVRLVMESLEYISASSQICEKRNTSHRADKPPSISKTSKPAIPPTDPRKLRLGHTGELILNLIMSHPIGNKCSQCEAFDEGSALRVLDEPAQGNFKYFAYENSTILSLFEHSGDQTYCVLVVRTPFERKCFRVEIPPPQLKSVSPAASADSSYFPVLRDLPRPKCPFNALEGTLEWSAFPSVLSQLSIPSMTEVELKANCSLMANLAAKQIKAEKKIASTTLLDIGHQRVDFCFSESFSLEEEGPSHFYATRLILSYLGLISQEKIKGDKRSSALCYLDSSRADFFHELKMVDLAPTKFHNTVFVLLVGQGQSQADSILSNASLPLDEVPPSFTHFLLSLGNCLSLDEHRDAPGFIGCLHQFWRHLCVVPQKSLRRLSLYSGNDQILFWEDVLNQLAFIVPMCSPPDDLCRPTTPKSLCQVEDEGDSLYFENTPCNIGDFFSHFAAPMADTPSVIGTPVEPLVIVAWFEDADDLPNFPLGSLGNQICGCYDSGNKQSRDIVGICLVPLLSGLVRVHIKVHSSRPPSSTMTSPLNDGMVINPNTLGSLVRKTILDIYRDKIKVIRDKDRLPHAMRATKIERLVKKWRLQMAEETFYTALFQTK